MPIEDDSPPGAPEWVVTFGDMMSLLLTFFIMLVSMSELKKEEQFQAMLDSMRRQFGHESASAAIPGDLAQANSSLAAIAPASTRALRKNLLRGANDNAAIQGDSARVQDIRRGRSASSGGVIYFAEEATELTESHKHDLAIIAAKLAGKPQKIEIRGHTSRHPVNPSAGLRDHWDLAFTRCYNTMQHLVTLGFAPDRFLA